MHPNSLSAYRSTDFTPRQQEVMDMLRSMGGATDRQIALALRRSDMNYVRPRVTELIFDNWVVEVGHTKDAMTGKTVRIVKALSPDERERLLEEARQGQIEMALH